MPDITVDKDLDAATLTITVDLDASVERAWRLLSDPRQLEQWWGPPGWPATFERFELEPGGVVTYAMSGPDGERSAGWWRIVEIEAPHRLVFDDGFGDDPDQATEGLPVAVMAAEVSERGDGSQIRIVTTYPDRASLEQVLEMGMEEGMSAALGQIDDVLAAG